MLLPTINQFRLRSVRNTSLLIMPFHLKVSAPLALLLALLALASTCSAPCAAKPISKPKTKPLPGSTVESRIRAQMAVLAGDALQGRGSGTVFELRAGQYIASQLQKLGVRPMGDADATGRRTFIQSVDLGRFSPGGPLNPLARAPRRTWNVIGALPGSDPKGSKEVILLSAHMDHLGTRPQEPQSDKIYNGADDDASGCVAVLELARALAQGPRTRRTVYFVFFGSEELGGLGARHFVANLPFPRAKLVANLEFEMIGRPDPTVARDTLWLTGFERSNLGPQLARQGARLIADPHPEQNFFQRSDNYVLAREGVIAHTVSSFGLHTDYHQPSDEADTIDFKHMARAITSMQKPVRWLAGSTFRPAWNEGMKP